MEPRRRLLSLFQEALTAVEGRRVVRRHLQSHPIAGELALVAMGKAAASMAQGAFEVAGKQITRSLIITKEGHGDDSLPGESCFGGHPLPDENSLRAGEKLLSFMKKTPSDAMFLFLISGGSSALVEQLPASLGLDFLHRANEWLLGSGLDIRSINAIRKRLSTIKGGRLAKRLQGRRAIVLMISDVMDNDPAVIGSGLLSPAGNHPLPGGLPKWLARALANAPPTPPAVDPSFRLVEHHVIATCHMAMRAAASAGRRAGLPVFFHPDLFKGDLFELAERLVTQVREGPPGLYVWGGESTVVLPLLPGRGGRNQSLALAVSRLLAGDRKLYFLAAGTDGTDGPTADAGALVDGTTLLRGTQNGLDAESALFDADAGTYLAATGDLVRTGPTGTNVMDLVMALKLPD